MSSVRPTRGKADNSAGSPKPLFQRLVPRVRHSFWPGAQDGSTARGRRYDCRRDPLLFRIRPSEAAKASGKDQPGFSWKEKIRDRPHLTYRRSPDTWLGVRRTHEALRCARSPLQEDTQRSDFHGTNH